MPGWRAKNMTCPSHRVKHLKINVVPSPFLSRLIEVLSIMPSFSEKLSPKIKLALLSSCNTPEAYFTTLQRVVYILANIAGVIRGGIINYDKKCG